MSPTPDSSIQLKAKHPHLSKAIHHLEKMALQALSIEDTPGLAVAVFDCDTVHYMSGFGLKRREYPNEPMTPCTLFQMASVSKPMSATVMAIFQQKGLCSLKDHPHPYLPALFNGDAYNGLTLEHILNHSSGITYEGFEELIESYIPRKLILEKLVQTHPTSKPGEKFEYNNVVFGLIGDIMESMTGKNIGVVLKEYLFDPLKMEHACVGLPDLLEASDRFYPYMEDLEGNLVPATHYSHSYYIFPTSAGINASVKDLISFTQLYLGKYPDIIPKEALAPLLLPTINANKSLEFLGMPRDPIKEAWYGLGWLLLNIGQERVVYHTGYLNGVRNFVGFLPNQEIGIVLLANTERLVASRLGLEFFYQYLAL